MKRYVFVQAPYFKCLKYLRNVLVNPAQLSGLRPSSWGDGVPYGCAVASASAHPRGSR